MNKKIKLKSGLFHQLYIAVFASLGVVLMFVGIYILALIVGEPAIKSLIILYRAIIYPLSAIWLIFILVRIFYKSEIEINEKGFIKRRWNKILWEIDWNDLEKIEYFKMQWHYFLEPNIYKGELVLTVKRKDLSQNEQMINLFQKDVKRIMKEFQKEIKIY